MKVLTFLYFTGFEIMVKGFPQDDPHREALKDMILPVAIFFSSLFMLVFVGVGFWEYVISIWDPQYVKGGKYNPLAPSSVLFLISWLVTAKVLKLYFQRTSVQTEILNYYRINNKQTNKYDTHGRLLTVFFFFAPFIIGGVAVYFGWYSVIPLVLSLIAIEIWIRKEFGIGN